MNTIKHRRSRGKSHRKLHRKSYGKSHRKHRKYVGGIVADALTNIGNRIDDTVNNATDIVNNHKFTKKLTTSLKHANIAMDALGPDHDEKIVNAKQNIKKTGEQISTLQTKHQTVIAKQNIEMNKLRQKHNGANQVLSKLEGYVNKAPLVRAQLVKARPNAITKKLPVKAPIAKAPIVKAPIVKAPLVKARPNARPNAPLVKARSLLNAPPA
jgi:hypothetical protein